VILGLDPGWASLGWGLLDLSGPRPRCLGAGVIRTKPNPRANKCDDNVERCAVLHDALVRLHDEHRFIIIAAEAQSWTRFAQADRGVAMAWGVIAATAERFNCPVVQIRPQDVKKQLTGAQSTTKAHLQKVVENLVADAPGFLAALAKTQQNHASDALAVAVASEAHDLVRAVKRYRGNA
jgi:crossover junction endodeoxyribonuclease RuvC